MQREIPKHDPYTGELNPYYEQLTGQPNPLNEVNFGGNETYYIKEEKLTNGKSRYYPIKKISLDGDKSWNEEHLLRKWYPAEENDYCYSYNLAKVVIEKNKEFLTNTFPEVTEVVIHTL